METFETLQYHCYESNVIKTSMHPGLQKGSDIRVSEEIIKLFNNL